MNAVTVVIIVTAGKSLEVCTEIKKLNSKVNIIFHTVCDEREHAKEVLRIKPSGYLVKPAKKEQLEAELRSLRYSAAVVC